MNIEELFKDRGKENISALAFNLGRLIEGAIEVQSDNLIEKNKLLEAKILEFSRELNKEINITPTGAARNKLTVINIKFIEIFNLTKFP